MNKTAIIASLMAYSMLLGSAQGKDTPYIEEFASNSIATAAGHLPGCLSRFRSYPPDAGKLGFPRCLFENPFPPNSDFWLKGVDFSCASPWNDSFGRMRAGTAISRRHILFAKHFPLAVGTRMAFVGETGDTSHYTIKATKALDDCDVMVGLLDYELTPDVHPAKVLPVEFDKWLPLGSRWPVITLNQHELGCYSEIERTTPDVGNATFSNELPETGVVRKFTRRMIQGDSGCPAFLLYHGRPILLYCIYCGGSGHGPMIHKYRSRIQRLMDDLCPGYTLSEFSFE